MTQLAWQIANACCDRSVSIPGHYNLDTVTHVTPCMIHCFYIRSTDENAFVSHSSSPELLSSLSSLTNSPAGAYSPQSTPVSLINCAYIVEIYYILPLKPLMDTDLDDLDEEEWIAMATARSIKERYMSCTSFYYK